MKKALTAVLIVLLALFMVACDSNPNDEQTPPPEEKTFAPSWAEGKYIYNHPDLGEMNATIESDSFNIALNFGGFIPINIGYPDDTGKVKVDSNSNMDNPGVSPWKITLSGITIAGEGKVKVDSNSNMDNPGVSPWKITLSGITIAGEDPVKVTIENVIANEELKISVELGGDLSSMNEKLGNMLFSADNSSVVTE